MMYLIKVINEYFLPIDASGTSEYIFLFIGVKYTSQGGLTFIICLIYH